MSVSPLDLHALTAEQGRAWIESLDFWLLDCDGVVWKGSSAVSGVKEAVDGLLSLGKRVYYVSNNSTKSREEYIHKLQTVCGIAATREQIVTSAVAAADYCKANGITGKVFCVGQSGLIEELKAIGCEVLGPNEGASSGKSFSFGSLKPSDLDPEVQAVVVGFDGDASYRKIALASSYLRYGGSSTDGKGVRFVATNKDLTFPDSHMVVPGGGVIVGAIEAGSGRGKPDVVAGKPSQAMLDILLTAVGPEMKRERCVMVGDRLDTDIAFGSLGKLGSTLLVFTGVTTPESAASIASLPEGDPHRPTHCVPSLGDLAVLLKKWGVM